MSSSAPQLRERSRNALATLTSFFLHALQAPTANRPTVRVIAFSNAAKIISDASRSLDEPELRAESVQTWLRALQSSGVLLPLPLEPGGSELRLFGIGPGAPQTVDPIEILGAVDPKGVVCFFTSLQYHNLTTQIAPFHHIARIVERGRQLARGGAATVSAPPESAATRRRDPLGTYLFSYMSDRYYRTTRSAHTVPGIQLRQLNEKTLVRITNFEQTLLDTLQHPQRCGGPSVAWEAWERGVGNCNAARLAAHMASIADPRLTRRVGHVLQRLAATLPLELEEFLAAERDRLRQATDDDSIALFPGVAGDRVDPTWRVRHS